MAKLDLTIPTFVKGESGFAAKLNELASAVSAIQDALNAQTETPAPAAKTAARKATTKAE
jgi:hypothetical protein